VSADRRVGLGEEALLLGGLVVVHDHDDVGAHLLGTLAHLRLTAARRGRDQSPEQHRQEEGTEEPPCVSDAVPAAALTATSRRRLDYP